MIHHIARDQSMDATETLKTAIAAIEEEIALVQEMLRDKQLTLARLKRQLAIESPGNRDTPIRTPYDII